MDIISREQNADITRILDAFDKSALAIRANAISVTHFEHLIGTVKLQNSMIEHVQRSFAMPELPLTDTLSRQIAEFDKLAANVLSFHVKAESLNNIAASVGHFRKLLERDFPDTGFLNRLGSRDMLIGDVHEMTRTYGSILRDLNDLKAISSMPLPADLIEQPAAEVRLHTDLLFTLSPIETEESFDQNRAAAVADNLESRLTALDPELPRMLAGARTALRSDSPDKMRHSFTSLRELLSHALRLLAPDNDIKKWTSDPESFSEGKPTRRARLRFICKNISTAHFADFVESDIATAERVFDLCNKGVHGKAAPLGEKEVAATLARAEGLLRFWLELGKR